VFYSTIGDNATCVNNLPKVIYLTVLGLQPGVNLANFESGVQCLNNNHYTMRTNCQMCHSGTFRNLGAGGLSSITKMAVYSSLSTECEFEYKSINFLQLFKKCMTPWTLNNHAVIFDYIILSCFLFCKQLVICTSFIETNGFFWQKSASSSILYTVGSALEFIQVCPQCCLKCTTCLFVISIHDDATISKQWNHKKTLYHMAWCQGGYSSGLSWQ